MPRHFQARVRPKGRSRRDVFVALSEHERQGGSRESLRLTPDEVMVIRERGGETVAETIPLKELEQVRTRARVGRLDLIIALSYLLGAAVFLYLIVNLAGRLSDGPLLLVLGILMFFAAGGVAAAWFGQEAVVQFVSRGREKRIEYHLDESERERLSVLEAFTRLQRRD